MKKLGTLLFWLAALGICGLMTWLTRDAGFVFLTYNVGVLCVMLLIILITWAGGLHRMNRVRRDLDRACDTLEDVRKGRLPLKSVVGVNASLFDTEYLDDKYHEYLRFLFKSNAATDIADFIGEYEINNYTWRRTVELVPDILTSLGILGTFMGLVWGLKGFNPVSYEAMAGSITSLIDGIKVAFVTSIYGIALSVAYSYSVKENVSGMSESLDRFTDMYYLSAVPPTDNAAMNRIADSTRENTTAVREMSTQIAQQIGESVNSSLGQIAASVAESMKSEFFREFEDVRNMLRESNKAQEEFLKFVDTSEKQMTKNLREYSQASAKAAQDADLIHERNSGAIREQEEAMKEYTDNMSKAVSSMSRSAERSAKILQEMDERIETMEKLTQEGEQNAAQARNYARDARRSYNRSVSMPGDELDEISMLTDRLDHMIILMERSQKQQQQKQKGSLLGGIFGRGRSETDEERRALRERRWETRGEEDDFDTELTDEERLVEDADGFIGEDQFPEASESEDYERDGGERREEGDEY